MIGWRPLVCVVALLLAGCSDTHPSALADGSNSAETTSVEQDTENDAATTSTEPDGPASTAADDTGADPRLVTGTVAAATTGQPLSGARVTIGATSVLTDTDGSFEIDVTETLPSDTPPSDTPPSDTPPSATSENTTMLVERSAWLPFELELAEDDTLDLDVRLDPLTVRGIRVSREVAADPGRWRELLDLADDSSVNTLVFDTKDEASTVLYESGVALANELGAVEVVYDPEELIADANDRGLYTITRIVTFEDAVWANGDPEAKLAGSWVDAGNPANWRYPIDLAVEACQLGFDEIQFDYVRFPSGRTAELAADLVPQTGELRAKAIADFLATARAELEAEGCGISAAIFGIVMSSDSDERLGQTPETISAVVDAVSPMLYPSHYSPGWLGFADPNDHPGPVIAYSLDEGGDRVDAGSAMRPWIQGFYYSGEQIKAQIEEAEARGAGWIIWNAAGNYRADWLPPSSASG